MVWHDGILNALHAEGISDPEILWIVYCQGYPDVLCAGMSTTGEPVRGWWKHGESCADIRWINKTIHGWPETVQIPQYGHAPTTHVYTRRQHGDASPPLVLVPS